MARLCIHFTIVVVALGCVVSLGCSDPNIGIVSGMVLVDDAPANGSISFVPTNGKTAPQGGEIVDGAYEVTLPIGDAKVEIRVSKVVGEKKIYEQDPNSPVQDVLAEALPARYNDETELTYDVPSGKSTKDFDLSTKKKKK